VYLTEPDLKQETIHFNSEKEVLEALDRGEISYNTPISISPSLS
jgi:hypothetical protein